jgi:hypothetical protein
MGLPVFLPRRRSAALLLGVSAFLAGCGSMMSEQNVSRSFDQCLETGRSEAAKLIHCNIAIHSGRYSGKDLADLHFMKGVHFQNGGEHGKAAGAFSEALAIDPSDGEAYYFRGVSRRMLGQAEQAQADFDAALRLHVDPAVARAARANRRAMEEERLARERELERERNRPATLAYNGLWCPRVQRDSMFHQGNEIFIDVVVTDTDGAHRATTLPARGKTYQNIHDGGTRRANVTLWQGLPQPLMVQVVVWEHDDGGPLVEELTAVAIDFALTRGTRTLSRYAVKKGAHTLAARGGREAADYAIEQLDLTGQLSQSISSLPKALVGADNDLIGAIGITNVAPYAYGAPARENGFAYHFYTRHRGGGADCRVYFQFR